MGRRGGKRSKTGRGGGGDRGGGAVRAAREDIPQHNALFEEYYDGLGLYSPEEKDDFWAALRRELPNSFRFTGSKSHALQVQRRLKEHYIPGFTGITYEGQQVDPPAPLPWFPDQLAWQMTTPRKVVRRFPPFASFQKFLVSETAVGNISRQEAVSMIPPLLLDVKPGMTVLDLCAAPGSKSAQLIEMVHGGEEAHIRKVIRQFHQEQGREVSPEGKDTQHEMEEEEERGDWSDDGRSTGLLIANDVDWKRAHMLVHQMKRLNSPNLIVTNHDASQFPSLKLRSLPATNGASIKGRYLKFDRILADVPCTGDGTARKNMNVWKDWAPVNGLGLHVMQVRILVRSLQMLKVGGRMVYSTCSMNPVENEAVVAAAIDRCGGMEKVDLIDSSAMLPGLKTRKGLTNWRVLGRNGTLWSSWEDVVRHKEANGEANLGKITETCFPPTHTVPLERCMRVCAHYQDTGAFFIAILEKKSEIRARPEESAKATATKGTSAPISAIVDELDSKTNDGDPSAHVAATDSIIPPASNGQVDNSTPAMRPNEEPGAVDEERPDKKRRLEDAVEAPNKRVELANDAELPVERERRVHFPSPPGAELSSTAHHPNYDATSTGREKKKGQQYEEPFKYLAPDHEVLQSIYDFYGIDERFPRDRFLVRNASGVPAKKIYYTSALSKEILTENEGKGIKFVHAGVTMFVKQDVQSEEVCRWRIQTDGVQLIEGWVSDSRVVRLYSKQTLRKLLIDMFPKVTGGGWLELGEIGKWALDRTMGCHILRVEKGEGEDGFSERMVLPLWRSLHSLNLMLPKEERKAMLLRIYNDESPLIDSSKNRFKKFNEDNDDETSDRSRPRDDAVEDTKTPGSFDCSGDEKEEGGVILHESELVGELK